MIRITIEKLVGDREGARSTLGVLELVEASEGHEEVADYWLYARDARRRLLDEFQVARHERGRGWAVLLWKALSQLNARTPLFGRDE